MKRLVKIVVSKGIYFLLIGVLSIFSFILINLNETVEKLSQDMVRNSLKQTDLELSNFFEPIKLDLLIEANRISNEEFDSNRLNKFNQNFNELIKNKKQISSVLYATDEGNEFLLLDLLFQLQRY